MGQYVLGYMQHDEIFLLSHMIQIEKQAKKDHRSRFT